MSLLVLFVLGGFALYVMNAEERARLARTALAALRHLPGAVRQVQDAATQDHDPFGDALRERTPLALVTPVLVALNATIFVLMLFGAGAFSDPETLVGWGGNFGPRTTNGEWWRLVTTMFVHSGILHLLVNIAGLVQVGLILERLVGRLAFGAVYIAAGVFASLVSLWAHPMAVSVGASGAIFGLYGLLLASSIWGLIQRSTVTMPLTTVKRLAPVAGVFILYHVATNSLEIAAELSGLAVGFVSGLVLARGVSEHQPTARQVATVMAATVVIAVASAVPLRGVADVRPEIERIIAIEDRTASAYQTAVDQFKLGAITAGSLAKLIDRTIMPELNAVRTRLKAIEGVPPEHQPVVAAAEEYLRLRQESWRLRAEALHNASMAALRKADRAEWASLEAFKKIRPPEQQ